MKILSKRNEKYFLFYCFSRALLIYNIETNNLKKSNDLKLYSKSECACLNRKHVSFLAMMIEYCTEFLRIMLVNNKKKKKKKTVQQFILLTHDWTYFKTFS